MHNLKQSHPCQILIALCLILIFPVVAICSDEMKLIKDPTACISCQQFNDLNTQIRDQLINKQFAKKSFKELLPSIKKYAIDNGLINFTRDQWIFPLEGMNIISAGNNKGADYIASGYDYFDGNKHGGHPSFDLFIHDKNQDTLDDKTNKEVKVLSMTAGIVVSVEKEWNVSSKLRGGKYIWIYDITSDALVYYAHNKDIFVKVGDLVKPGDVIAKVGRTGLNAYKKRSPTHLHLTYLKIVNGYPKPENIYSLLLKVKTYVIKK